MESNEETELTRKMGSDSQIESRMASNGGRSSGGGGNKQKGKGIHGHGQ